MGKKLENLIGKRFDKLVVKDYAGSIHVGKTKASAWNCICDCGSETIVLNNNIRRGNTKSCGCFKKEKLSQIKVDLSGKIFGMLTVLQFVETINGNSMWLCQCSCGKTNVISNCSLQNGIKSCGCKQGWWRSVRPGLWKNPAEYSKWRRQDPLEKLKVAVSNSVRKMLINNGSYKRKKSIRNFLPYSIEQLKQHIEGLWEPWMNWGNYGGKSNDNRLTWWIDHIKPHSLFDYKSMDDPLFLECWSLSNLRPLEKKANIRKGNKFVLEG